MDLFAIYLMPLKVVIELVWSFLNSSFIKSEEYHFYGSNDLKKKFIRGLN